MNKYFKYTIIVLIIILVIVGFYSFITKYNKMEETDLQIYCFNAGKADACLVSVNGKHIMIDTGEDDLFPEIVQYFNAKKVQELDYLIITHFDKDHVGSAAKIIENYKVYNVLESNYKKESDVYNDYVNALSAKKIEPTLVLGDYKFNLEGLDVVVNGTKTLFDNNESNNSSLITSLSYGSTDFLFMADAQNARIKEFLKNNKRDYDFIKMPYHGKYMKRIDDLLEATKPRYALITSSKKEKEDTETINMLKNFGIKSYLTREGSVLIKSNGNKIVIEQR
jgi:beta-lactamase superfamily II metal-dependent hydrolase